jgi:simple sugar transport system permease protein
MRTLRIFAGRAAIVLFAFAAAFLLFWLTGFDLGDIARGFWQGSISAPGSMQATMRWTMTYAIIGAGVLISIRAGFFNIGAQGQFYAGACAAAAAGIALDSWPAVIAVPLVIIAAMLGGLLWSLGPGILRIKYGTDEVITTLMANFIAALMMRYLLSGPIQDPSSGGETKASKIVNPAFRISDGTGFSVWTALITLAVLVATWLVVNRSKFGVLSALAGRNPTMASWQGVDISKVGLVSFVASGGLAGLAGSLEVLGASGRISAGFSADVGFTSILVPVIGGLTVGGHAFVSLLFGALTSTIVFLPVVSDLPVASLNLIRGAVALFVTASPVAMVLLLKRSRARRFGTVGATP